MCYGGVSYALLLEGDDVGLLRYGRVVAQNDGPDLESLLRWARYYCSRVLGPA